MTMIIKSSIYVFLLLLYSSCAAQKSELKTLVQTDWRKYNLKGSVKEIVVRFDKNYSQDIPREKKAEYEFRNFWEMRSFPMGKCKFDSLGFITWQQLRFNDRPQGFSPIANRNKNLYVRGFDPQDFAMKRKITGEYNYEFPIFNPFSIEVSSFFKEDGHEGWDRKVIPQYKIEPKSQRILELVKITNELVTERSEYIYDEEGRIIKQELTLGEFAPPENRIFHRSQIDIGPGYDLLLSSLSNVYYSFEYDESDRLTLAKIVENDEIVWREKYYYEEDKTFPYKLDRFIVAAITYELYFSNYATERYNEYGDPLKSENYSDEGELLRTRFYDYKYDAQNNWIQCDMYLEGDPERTEKPTIIVYRDIDYYKNVKGDE